LLKHPANNTNVARVRAVIRFIGYLITIYVSLYFQNGTPKELRTNEVRIENIGITN